MTENQEFALFTIKNRWNEEIYSHVMNNTAILEVKTGTIACFPPEKHEYLIPENGHIKNIEKDYKTDCFGNQL